MARYQRNDGFTLVELLVTVAIMVLVMGLAIPKIQAAMDSGHQARVAKDLKTIHDALERHYADRGSYPLKLKTLVDAGYLKSGTTFKSPVSGFYYFYAVDDNDLKDSPDGPQAYVLGAPPRDALKGPNKDNKLHRAGPLPAGRNPNWTAYAWVDSVTGGVLFLYDSDDITLLPASKGPPNLADYRDSCRPESTTPCDLIAN